MTTVAVVGASGFVGSAVASALRGRGVQVKAVRAPRLDHWTGRGADDALQLLSRPSVEKTDLHEAFRGASAVVCCAGLPDASELDESRLTAANALVPALVGAAAASAGVSRFVHVSSAVVQGRLPQLDSSDLLDAFSPYSRSKATGERFALQNGPDETVVYRPPSVHAPSRRVTRGITRIAASPAASVAAPGDDPSPQAHIDNVASAITFLALYSGRPPARVHHPWEGHTTSGLMELLGRHQPRQIPRGAARAAVRATSAVGRHVAALAPNARRVEMLWFGQRQAPSWLTDVGWNPVTDHSSWVTMGDEIRRQKETS